MSKNLIEKNIYILNDYHNSTFLTDHANVSFFNDLCLRGQMLFLEMTTFHSLKIKCLNHFRMDFHDKSNIFWKKYINAKNCKISCFCCGCWLVEPLNWLTRVFSLTVHFFVISICFCRIDIGLMHPDEHFIAFCQQTTEWLKKSVFFFAPENDQ